MGTFGAAGEGVVELAVRETLVARPGLLPVNEFAPRPVRGAEHHITLEAGTRPRWQPPMRLDHASRAEMRKFWTKCWAAESSSATTPRGDRQHSWWTGVEARS